MTEKIVTIGLADIKVGKASLDGVMPSSMEKIGRVYQDKCSLEQDAPEVIEHFEEGNPSPIVRFVEQKPPKIKFSLFVDNLDILKEYVGGSVDSEIYSFTSAEVNNVALRIEPKQGLVFDMPNASISANLKGELTKKGILLLEVEGTPLNVENGKYLQVYKKGTNIG